MMERLLSGLLLMLLPIMSNAESVTDLVPQPNGTYLLKIDGKRYVALSPADVEQTAAALAANVALKQQLEATTAKLEQYQALTHQYEELRQNYVALSSDYHNLSGESLRLNHDFSTAASNLVILNRDYSQLVKDYDSLTEKYRDAALRSHPRNPLDIALGAVSTDSKTQGVVMVGTGTRVLDVDVRAWLIGGQDSYGVLLGSSF